MSLKGIKKNQFVAVTLCDFGDPERRTIIRTHFSRDAADRAFKRIARIYTGIHGWRCWQEDRFSRSVFNDTTIITSEQILAVNCAYADLCGALQARNQMDVEVHDWKSHKRTIIELQKAFSFIEPVKKLD